jgi:hypothetical protein
MKRKIEERGEFTAAHLSGLVNDDDVEGQHRVRHRLHPAPTQRGADHPRAGQNAGADCVLNRPSPVPLGSCRPPPGLHLCVVGDLLAVRVDLEGGPYPQDVMQLGSVPARESVRNGFEGGCDDNLVSYQI